MMSQSLQRSDSNQYRDGGVPTVYGFLDFLAENGEIRKLKWLESEKAGFDIGVAHALSTWMNERRHEWRDRQADTQKDASFAGAIGSHRRWGVTLSLPDREQPWPEAYMSDLDAACRSAAELGYELVELSIPDIGAEAENQIQRVHSEYQVGIAALATRAGWLAHGLNLVNPNPVIRDRAIDYAARTIMMAAPVDAAVIVSSWVGADYEFLDQTFAANWLSEGLSVLADFGEKNGVKILFEPMSRGGMEDARIIDRGRHLVEFVGSSNLGLAAKQTQLTGSDSVAGVEYIRYVAHDGIRGHERHLEFASLLTLLDCTNFSGTLVAECLP